MIALDVGVAVGTASLPSIDDFFGSASVPGGAAHQRPVQPKKAASSARTPPPDAKAGSKKGSVTFKDSGRKDKKGPLEARALSGGFSKPQHSRASEGGDGAAGKKRQRSEDAVEEPSNPADSDSDVEVDDKNERTVFVGGVPMAEEGRLINPKTIKAFFRDCGEVESVRLRSLPVENPVLPKKAAIAMGKINGKRETCNAYVVFKSKDSMAAALRKDGASFGDEGHRIRVDEAKPPGEGGKSHNVRLSIFVGNVPFNAEEEALRNHFSKCGEITKVRLVRDSKTLVGKGFGYVTFTDCDAVSDAMALNGSKLLKRELRVTRCSKKPSPAQLGGTGGPAGKKGAKKVGNNRMGAEFRRRKQRDTVRAGKEESGDGKAKPRLLKGGKPAISDKSKAAKLKKTEKYLKIKKTPKFKDRKKDKGANNGIKGSASSKGEKRRGKEKKSLKKAKKAFKGKKRKA
jgi:RNA recognition motif-containing protein